METWPIRNTSGHTGQGFHNLLGDLYRDFGRTVDSTGQDTDDNPYTRPEIEDSPLTAVGRAQARGLRATVRALGGIELVVASPLRRAIETAARERCGDYVSRASSTRVEKKPSALPRRASSESRQLSSRSISTIGGHYVTPRDAQAIGFQSLRKRVKWIGHPGCATRRGELTWISSTRVEEASITLPQSGVAS